MDLERWTHPWFLLSIVAECLLGVPFPAMSQDAPVPSSAASPAPASAELLRFELGINFADIRSDCIASGNECGLPSFALGAGASFNFNSHFAMEADAAVTPTSSEVATTLYGGRHSEYLLGVRGEVRARHYGYFLKAQPGASSWNHVITRAITPPNGQFYFLYGDRRSF